MRPLTYREGYKKDGWTILTIDSDTHIKVIEIGCELCGKRKWVSKGSLKNGIVACKCQAHTCTPLQPPKPLMKATNYKDGISVNTANGIIIVHDGHWVFKRELDEYMNKGKEANQ